MDCLKIILTMEFINTSEKLCQSDHKETEILIRDTKHNKQGINLQNIIIYNHEENNLARLDYNSRCFFYDYDDGQKYGRIRPHHSTLFS